MVRLILALLFMSCVMVLSYNILTETPGYVALLTFFAFVLGGLIVDTADREHHL